MIDIPSTLSSHSDCLHSQAASIKSGKQVAGFWVNFPLILWWLNGESQNWATSKNQGILYHPHHPYFAPPKSLSTKAPLLRLPCHLLLVSKDYTLRRKTDPEMGYGNKAKPQFPDTSRTCRFWFCWAKHFFLEFRHLKWDRWIWRLLVAIFEILGRCLQLIDLYLAHPYCCLTSITLPTQQLFCFIRCLKCMDEAVLLLELSVDWTWWFGPTIEGFFHFQSL